jgi:hypothetical protein
MFRAINIVVIYVSIMYFISTKKYVKYMCVHTHECETSCYTLLVKYSWNLDHKRDKAKDWAWKGDSSYDYKTTYAILTCFDF